MVENMGDQEIKKIRKKKIHHIIINIKKKKKRSKSLLVFRKIYLFSD
jgi:hypothetical protein